MTAARNSETRQGDCRDFRKLIQACLDGELGKDEAGAVRAHCGTCFHCRAAWQELQGLQRIIETDASADLPASLWPAIASRLAERGGRRFGWALSLSAVTASVAGLLIGILLDPDGGTSDQHVWQQDTWSAVGSLLAEDAGATLDDVYLAAMQEGEDEQ